MDKVLKYKFWILSALVLPMALAGFFMANGAIKSATAERVGALESLQAPNAQQPNDTHKVVATKSADLMEALNAQELVRLDQTQRKWMKWPPLIEEIMERDPATGQIVYRGENYPDQDKLSRMRVQYPDEYKKELQRVWLSVNPVVPSGLPYSDQSKKKVFVDPATALPRHTLAQTPTIADIWDAQEDLWILEMLFAAINQTNESATNVNDAAIREIFFVELFGGSGTSSVTAAPAEGASSSYMGGSEYEETGGATGQGLVVPFAPAGAISFDPQEEYGLQVDAAAATGPSGDYMSGGLFGGTSAGAKPLRYIGFDPAAPGDFRKRGYMIALLIQEKRIPDFIVNLGNLDPPVSAGRWGFANNPFDSDHLLKPAFTNIPSSGEEGYSRADYTSIGTGGGAGAIPRPKRAAMGAAGVDSGAQYTTGSGMPGQAGFNLFDPRARPLTPAQLLELQNYGAARQGKDLVALTLTGEVTIFTPKVAVPPVVEEPEVAAPPAGEPVPAGETAPAGAPVSEPAPPAADPAAPPPVDPGLPPTDGTAAAPEPAPPAAEQPPPSAESPPPESGTPATPPAS